MLNYFELLQRRALSRGRKPPGVLFLRHSRNTSAPGISSNVCDVYVHVYVCVRACEV